MNKKLYFLIIILLFSICSNAQDLQKHKEVVGGLNNYMEFIHQTCHTLYMMQADITNFNADIISRSKNSRITVNFNNREYLTNTWYYSVLPPDLYQTCLQSEFGISKIEKFSLDAKLKELMLSIDSLQQICNSIEKYTNQKDYVADSNFVIAFSLLEKSANMFDYYYEHWELLRFDIKNIMAKYEVIDMQNPYIRTAKNLDSLFFIVYSIAESVKNNDTTKLEQLEPKLEQRIDFLETSMNENLEGATKYGRSNGKDPYGRYESVIFDAKAELSHVRSFLKKTKYPHYQEKIYGKPYHWYNNKIVNKFNRHGIGMAYDYNNYADNSNNLVLKQAQLPQTLIAIYPEKKEISTTPQFTLEDSPANNLIFLLDVSGSMNRPNKLPLLKKSIKLLLTLMRDYDYVTIVTYSGSAKVRLKPTSAKDSAKINDVISKLHSGGETNVYAGLKLAYKFANKNYLPEGNNRIILATDGDFAITNKMKYKVKKNSPQIVLSIFYFNDNVEKKKLFDDLANLGNGNCVRITKDNINILLIKEARGE